MSDETSPPSPDSAQEAIERHTERRKEFRKELSSLLNRHSRENDSNTPDFILAQHLDGLLRCFELSVLARDKWYGIQPRPGGGPDYSIPKPVEPPIERIMGQWWASHQIDKQPVRVQDLTKGQRVFRIERSGAEPGFAWTEMEVLGDAEGRTAGWRTKAVILPGRNVFPNLESWNESGEGLFIDIEKPKAYWSALGEEPELYSFGPFATKNEAIQAAADDWRKQVAMQGDGNVDWKALALPPDCKVSVGINHLYAPSILDVDVIDSLINHASDNYVSDLVDQWDLVDLKSADPRLTELNDALDSVLQEWLNKHGLQPKFGNVEDVEIFYWSPQHDQWIKLVR